MADRTQADFDRNEGRAPEVRAPAVASVVVAPLAVNWTQTQIDGLQAAIASGVLSVTFGNRTTTYQSVEAMRAALAEMVRAVNPDARTYRLAAHSKGV